MHEHSKASTFSRIRSNLDALSNFQCIRRRLDTILGRFGVNLGGSETLALERARARSTFDEIDFFRLGDRLGVDFVPPDAF